MPSTQHDRVANAFRSSQQSAAPVPLATRRIAFDAIGTRRPLPEGATVTPVEANGVPCEWVCSPGAEEVRVVEYLHGGGYLMGSLDSHREFAARISSATRARVLLVDYRLAPEFPYPAGLNDATTAFEFLIADGVEPERLAIAGDSAGGGLALATLVSLRDQGLPLPACCACLSPWADLTLGSAETLAGKVDDPVNTLEALREMSVAYCDGAKAADVSPVHADLSGLPPLLVQVGTAEILLADARAVADRARSRGTDVVLEEFPDLMHVFQYLAPTSPEAATALEHLGSFVQHHTNH